MTAVRRRPRPFVRQAAPVAACDAIPTSLAGFTAGDLFPILDHLAAALACLDRETGLVSCRVVCDNHLVDQYTNGEMQMPNMTKTEMTTIVAIAKRAVADVFKPQGVQVEFIDVMMDLEFTHAVIPLRLDELLVADAGNFGHDIAGIYQHFNRVTKTMDDCFVPRFAVPAVAA